MPVGVIVMKTRPGFGGLFCGAITRLRGLSSRVQAYWRAVKDAVRVFYQRKGVVQSRALFEAPAVVPGDPQASLAGYLAKLHAENHAVPHGVENTLNPYEIHKGDIILVRPKEGRLKNSWEGVKFKQTYMTQLKILRDLGVKYSEAKRHARFTHVVVCRNGHEIFESLPFIGVRLGSYWSIADEVNYDVTVRRLKHHSTEESRAKPLANIEADLGNSYGFFELAALKARALNLQFLAKLLEWLGDDESYICSALYAEACRKEGIDLGFESESAEMITPAHLSLSSALKDVPITRLKIAENLKNL